MTAKQKAEIIRIQDDLFVILSKLETIFEEEKKYEASVPLDQFYFYMNSSFRLQEAIDLISSGKSALSAAVRASIINEGEAKKWKLCSPSSCPGLFCAAVIRALMTTFQKGIKSGLLRSNSQVFAIFLFPLTTLTAWNTMVIIDIILLRLYLIAIWSLSRTERNSLYPAQRE